MATLFVINRLQKKSVSQISESYLLNFREFPDLADCISENMNDGVHLLSTEDSLLPLEGFEDFDISFSSEIIQERRIRIQKVLNSKSTCISGSIEI